MRMSKVLKRPHSTSPYIVVYAEAGPSWCKLRFVYEGHIMQGVFDTVILESRYRFRL